MGCGFSKRDHHDNFKDRTTIKSEVKRIKIQQMRSLLKYRDKPQQQNHGFINSTKKYLSK